MNKISKIEIYTIPLGEEKYLHEMSELDENGNVISEIEYLPDGSIEHQQAAIFDKQNRKIEEIQYDEEELAEHKHFIYTDDGKLDKVIINYADGSVSEIDYSVDQVNNIESIIETDEDGELESKEINHFDESKRILRKELFDYRDQLTEANEYVYDELGNMICRRQLDNKRKLIVETRYQYNSDGQANYRANFNRKGKLSDFLKIEYDQKGQVIRQNFNGKFSFVFEYDQHGKILLEERYAANNQLESHTRYIYDENNRILKEEGLQFTREYLYHYHN